MKILMKSSEGWKAVEPKTYQNEAALQGLLKESPEIIPRDPRGGAVSTVWCREFPTDAGPVDLVGVGSDGSITVMECKLARNPQVRREVVGQVVDYASALWKMPIEAFEELFERLDGLRPADRLAQVAAELGPGWDASAMRTTLAETLSTGAFRLLIAVDELDEGLKRIIEYVNRQGSGQRLKLVALSFPMYTHGATEILVPESYGDEASTAAVPGGGPPGRVWSAAAFMEALSDEDHTVAREIAQELISWMGRHGTSPTFGKGFTGPMYVNVPTPDGAGAPAFDMTSHDTGTFEVLFNVLSKVRPFDRPEYRHALKDRLNAIPGVKIQDRTAENATWSNFSTERFADPIARRSLMDTLDWVASVAGA